jgi:Stress responsive A/B Barrel Domain
MIHHVALFQTLPHVNEEKLGQMMIAARSRLARIADVAAVRTGKNVDPTAPWGFFVAVEVDNLDRLKQMEADPIYIKFLAEVISPNVSEQFIASYELEPGKSIRFS